MRVHELAKKLGYNSSDFIGKISEMGIQNKKTLSSLSEDEVKIIEKGLQKKQEKASENKVDKTVEVEKNKLDNNQNKKFENKKQNNQKLEMNNSLSNQSNNNQKSNVENNKNNENRNRKFSENREGNRNFVSRDRNNDRDNKNFGNRDRNDRNGENRNFGNRDRNNDQNNRNFGNRDRNDRNGDNRNFGNRDRNNDRDNRNFGNRDRNDRNGENRSFGNRDRNNDRDNRGFGSRDRNDRDNRNFGNKRKEAPKDEVSAVVAPATEKPKSGGKGKAKFDKKKYEKDKKKKEQELRELRTDFRRDDKKKKKNKKQEKAVKDEIVRLEGESIGMITIGEEIPVKTLAEKLGINVSDIIKKFFMEGKVLTANAILSFEEAEEVALEYEVIVEKEEVEEVSYGEKYHLEVEDKKQDLVTRAPIITIMGHVDHGKTSLLDALRHTNVIQGEAGGITQKIGAYQVNWKGQKITFIDTPGHEAFTEMRARGANITDISILIVAADDGVKPQTVEAISHAKEAGVPIIVAINKIDKPGADPMKVRTELTEYGLMSPDWGGTTEFVEISAKQKINLDELLETILITAELQELKANPKKRPKAVVIESRLDPQMGAVADLLIQEGQLEIGDIFVAGESHGRVRSMVDDRGNKIKKATLSQPVEITGFSTVPNAGDILYGVNNDKQAKKIVEDFIKEKKINEQNKKKHISLESLSQELEEQQLKELKCIIRADSKGSVEALKESLAKLNNEKVMINIIQASAGAVTEGDVKLAEASDAIVIAFNVRPTTPAISEAEKTGVEIRNYNVIYHLTEEIEKAMSGMLDPEFKEVYLGRIEVKQVFKVSNVGNIAGAIVVDGKVSRHSKIRVVRDGIIIFDGELASLKRFKDDAKEVVMGQECGIGIQDFNDIKEGDIIESYILEEIPR
ncbi:translation initiation factor IF-2 [Leptotrichia sp.]|uniref:translation initiation factor IF-2 n=1 Tax=Leptotrichia sp. TaxID=104608 RepID=UPI0018286270|nr:translation initiation factor IF-2 [Leptotrichia sp.]MBB1535042.1 translation initiation factor IF-2 [Leptotrichia sp.]